MRVFYTVFFILASFQAMAQPTALLYRNAKNINPAFINTDGDTKVNFYTSYKSGDVYILGDIETNLPSIHSGFGLRFYKEAFGLNHSNEIELTYNYTLPVSEKWQVSAGFAFNYYVYIVGIKDYRFVDETNPIFDAVIKQEGTNSNLGLSIGNQNFRAGITVVGLLKPSFSIFDSVSKTIPMQYNFLADYRFKVSKNLEITPGIYTLYQPDTNNHKDYDTKNYVNARIYQHFLLGAEYGYNYNEWTFSAGLDVFDTLEWWFTFIHETDEWSYNDVKRIQTSIQIRF